MASASEPIQKAIYQELATLGKAFSSPIRLEILDLLSQKEHSVEELVQKTGVEVANASQHLQKLKQAKLLESYKEGTRVRYRITEPKVLELWAEMRKLALSRNAEVERLLKDLHGEKEGHGFDAEDLLKKVDQEELLLVDVRPEDEFEAGHIADSLSVPYDRIEEELERIPKDRPIVAYCRGPFCVMSDEAVKFLRKHGYRASSFQEGSSGWVEKGLPTAKDQDA